MSPPDRSADRSAISHVQVNRRDFLRAVGLTGVATAAACDPKVPIENVLPYVVQPEQIVPGTSTWFSTRCEECGAGCGTIARVREGRVVKLEGNPDHPTNQGKLCARGLAGIQATYSPDRFTGPTRGRSARSGTPVTWDAALAEVGAAVAGARGSVAWLGRPHTGSLAALAGQFVKAAGGRMVMWEPLSRDSLRAATRAVFGRDTVPAYVLDDARTIVSFGADFLGTWGDVMGQTRGWANSREPARGGFVSRLVCIEPRIGTTSAMADLHLAPIPGTEAGIALALAALVARRNGYTGPATVLLRGVDVVAAADQADLTVDNLERVADWLAEGDSVVLPGGTATSARPTELAIATLVLAGVAGNIGHSVVFGPEPNMDGQSPASAVQDLLDDCRAGRVKVLLIDDLDPVFALPAEARVVEALARVDLLVAFTDEPTDSLLDDTLVLPHGSTLENWGDGEEIRGRHTLQQAVMRTLHDTRAMGDVLLAVARAAGLQPPPLPEPAAPPVEEKGGVPVEPAPAAPAAPTPPHIDAADWVTYVKARWETTLWEAAGRPDRFDRWFADVQKRGGWFEEIPSTGASFQLAARPDTSSATPNGDGLVLTVFPHPFLLDGRHANKPWAQEVPEPISSYAWGTWVEVHPETAERLDLSVERAVRVATPYGSIECGWFGSPGIRRDTVAVIMGNGHQQGGRYSRWGANPMNLLPMAVDATSGALSLVSTRAQVDWIRSPGPVHATLGSMTQEGRNLSFVASVADLAEHKGRGEAIATHHFPVDERLEKAGITDMYPEPNHPTYRFAMAVDLNRCNGCGACETACYSENNIPVVGPEEVAKKRNMGWLRLSRFWEGEGESPDVRFHPIMCQQCGQAPCEGVCPVLATYHNLDGLNAMVYNRCVGTRYCANNCPYSARRFNYHTYKWPESYNLMLNPDLSTREMGVMEKCTFCVQRLREAKDHWRDEDKTVPSAALRKLTACAQACPSDAITFGNLIEAGSEVATLFNHQRAFAMLDELNVKPGVRYLARIKHIESQHHGVHGRRSGLSPDHHQFDLEEKGEPGRTQH